MAEPIDITKRYYEVRLLNDDLAKSNDDRMLGTDVRISPSGAIEFNQVYTDSESINKVFFNGSYYIKEMPLEEFEELQAESMCDHEHPEDPDGDDE